MKYVKNTKMDFIQTDDTSLAVYDPESGDTHFFDETGTDILSFLSEPCGLEELLEKLCGVYEAAPGDIRGDVEEFLREVMEKGVVVEA
ncbi:MAG: HPr-rel-A system PqqD family peptide chaperone [Hydrogeniiclostridium sp.]|mgnify:FL=1|jgi:PqqD family protein of HPr-rel-A system